MSRLLPCPAKVERGSRRFLGTWAAALLLLAGAIQGAAAPKVPNPAALDATLDGFVKGGHYPFLYARLEDRDGNVLYEHSAVNRELLPDVAVDGQTWFRVWSMSKIVTITVVMDLVEAGALKLEDPVTQYLPALRNLQVAVTTDGRQLSDLEDEERVSACPTKLVPMSTEMTLLHLINHQAGFYYATTNIPCLDEPLAAQNVATAKNTADFIQRLTTLPLIQQPGAGYYYGTNTTILGMVAEQATGKTLKQLVEERLTGPLNIRGLRYGLPPEAKLLPRISGQDGTLRPAHPGELDIFGKDVPGYHPDNTLYLGGEGMLATADGYTDFLRMLLRRGELNGHRFLNQATVATLHAPHTLTDSPYGYNGFNLWVSGQAMRDAGHGEAGLWIGGGYEGTHFWIDPKREFVGIVMSQLFGIPPGGEGRDDKFRGALYRQFWAEED